MAEAPYLTPDLSAVLRTLAAYGASTRTQDSGSQSFKQYPQHNHNNHGPRDSADADLTLDLEAGAYDLRVHDITQPKAASIPTVPPTTVPTAAPPTLQGLPRGEDVASKDEIKTYPAALRYITALLAARPSLTAAIRRLIARQHAHERQWWRGREDLLLQQRSRAQARAEIDAVLRAVGGFVGRPRRSRGIEPQDGGDHGRATDGHGHEHDNDDDDGDDGNGDDGDEVEWARELRVYDRKVLDAWRAMGGDVRRDLGAMGIPFFGHGAEERWRGADEREKLAGLRRRVLDVLEDLCAEE